MNIFPLVVCPLVVVDPPTTTSSSDFHSGSSTAPVFATKGTIGPTSSPIGPDTNTTTSATVRPIAPNARPRDPPPRPINLPPRPVDPTSLPVVANPLVSSVPVEPLGKGFRAKKKSTFKVFLANVTAFTKPHSFKDEMEFDVWRKAMGFEITALEDNDS
ncbi:PREDICTED: merozoite surface protein CMZ-8-like [Camelina sativa]|uniref:Merozoite surface protein CMZ-8-like n=1 Tax=Camelina sativa TaxID=90675 RepID=A0ABM0V674_CAMSA|nr:PREDICTED: merozoite surface protein CMZ-8-like [Camelina sativa]